MRSVFSGFAVVAVLAGMAGPSFASQETLAVAMGKVTTCRTVEDCKAAWLEFRAQLGTAGLSEAAMARLQVAAVARVTENLGGEAAVFLADASVQSVVTSASFQTAAGSGEAASCNFSEASGSGFCS
jgi:hypothetical protein